MLVELFWSLFTIIMLLVNPFFHMYMILRKMLKIIRLMKKLDKHVMED